MCGRYVLARNAAKLASELAAEFAPGHLAGGGLRPSWNIAPSHIVPIAAEREGVRELRLVRWGLVPSWAKDPSRAVINARSETVASKPSFRAAAARRRCLIPADGYYEWMPTSAGKTPYYLHDPGGGLLAMAGIYELWRDPERAADDPEALRWTCAVITRAAPDALGHIHDRSPVVVPRGLRADWLDCADSTAADAVELLAALPPPHLVPREVSRAVGSVRNDSPSLIEPAGEPVRGGPARDVASPGTADELALF